ncbi:MAG: hypothetical protein FWD76_03150 [Firmicutes bacterium]|nr:hypothetical protein [Bacillota bacterium]
MEKNAAAVGRMTGEGKPKILQYNLLKEDIEKCKAYLDVNGLPSTNFLDIVERYDDLGLRNGTYDIATGKVVDLKKDYRGCYCVAFQQNGKDFKRRGYEPLEYDNAVYYCMVRLGLRCLPRIGVFEGVAEISFVTSDLGKAFALAEKFNQYCIWNIDKWEERRVSSEIYDAETNPIKA